MPLLPVWLVFVLGLIVEGLIWLGLCRWLVQAGYLGPLAAVVCFLTLVLGVRALIVLAIAPRSLRASERLGLAPPLPWQGRCKLYLGEYKQLVTSSLVKLPFPWFFRSAADRGDRLEPQAGRSVVLLQHGFANNGAVWRAYVQALEARGHVVFTIDQPYLDDIEQMAERLHARISRALARTGAEKLQLVCHSMGGLIARAYLRRYGASRLQRLITIGSPHHGTKLARIALGRNGQQMRIGNPWLAALNAQALPEGLDVLSIYSLHDTVIVPQDSSRLPGSRHIVLTGIGHLSQLSRGETLDAVVCELECD